MSEFATKCMHGFDTAVLTYKNDNKPSPARDLSFSKTHDKRGLLLISNGAPGVSQTVSKGKQQKVGQTPRNRKTITHNSIFNYNGKNYSVNAAKSGLYVETLKSLINQFELALHKWGRLFVLRFDLHQHCYTGNNKRITAFIKRLFNKLKRDYGFTEIGYCWVRERERAKAQHYHFVLFLDGRLIRHSSRINELIIHAWDDGTGTYHVPTIKNPYYIGKDEQFSNDVIYRASYLAKARGKGYRDKQAKDFQCSRMKLG